MWQVPLFDSNLGDEEEQAVLKVLKSGWLTMGPQTEAFETSFAEFVGSKHAVAVANCTAALHLSLLVADIGPGDEVLCPSLTFAATANAIAHTGATPVFVEIGSEDDLRLCPLAAATCITPKTKAIIVMHYAGYPCDMKAFRALAQEHNLTLIEDAAHAHGTRQNGRNSGTLGDIACFSFYSNKNMTTGEGGMLTTDCDAKASRLRLLRSHGMTTSSAERHSGRVFSYQLSELGYNYRIDDMRSALGLVQLKRLGEFNDRRREIAALYRREFDQLKHSGIHLPFANLAAGDEPSYHIQPAILSPDHNPLEFRQGLKLRGIQTSHHYPPVHSCGFYRRENGEPWVLKVTEDVAAREVTLPLYPGMRDDQVLLVCAAVAEVLNECTT